VLRRPAQITLLLAGCLAIAGLISAGRPMGSQAAPSTHSLFVNDPKLGVTWLANADLAATKTFGVTGISKDGSMGYLTARAWVKAMDKRDYLGHHTWTLPVTPTPYEDSACSGHNNAGGGSFGIGCTIAAMPSLYHYTLHLRSPETVVKIPSSTTGPFVNFQPSLYMTNTEHKNHRGTKSCCFTFSFNTGRKSSNTYLNSLYLLPAIPGNAFQAAQSGQALQPVDGGRAVYEAISGTPGVTWLANADLAAQKRFGVTGISHEDGAMTHTAAASWIDAMDSANGGRGWLDQRDWTFPTQTELGDLYGALGLSSQEPVVPVPDTFFKGFSDMQPYLYWSCGGGSITGGCTGLATGTVTDNGFAWSFLLGNGFQGTTHISGQQYVMVYYPDAPAGKPPPPPCKTNPNGTSTCT